jgi:uncharacterized RDD family membrane protein YckC
MYPLKRIGAYVIDMVLIFGPVSLLFQVGAQQIFTLIPVHIQLIGVLGGWVVSLALPIVIIGSLTGLTGRSPGKFIMFLKVEDHGGDPPGIAQGILREIIKAVSLGFFLGMLFALQGLVRSGQTFYDEWLDLTVADLRPAGLTETQKNYRKYMREQARKQKR